MLRALAEDPKGEKGFRQHEVSHSAIQNGWVKRVWESGRIAWYSITDEGRKAYLAAENRRRPLW
jgi:hypothetical protein